MNIFVNEKMPVERKRLWVWAVEKTYGELIHSSRSRWRQMVK